MNHSLNAFPLFDFRFSIVHFGVWSNTY